MQFDIKRISWGAIFAGVVIVLVSHLVFTTLGISIGASSIEPLTEANPFANMGTGTLVWLGVSSIISLFLGGLVVGHLSGGPTKLDGVLHGVVTWGLASLIGAFFIVRTATGIVQGAAGVVEKGVSLAGEGVKAATPEGMNIDIEEMQKKAKAKTQQFAAQAEQKARETGDKAARGVSQASLAAFFILIVGMIAAASGGFLGAPTPSPTQVNIRDELNVPSEQRAA